MNRFFFFSIFFFFISSSLVLSIGISEPPRSERFIVFEPGEQVTIGFGLQGAQYIHSYIAIDKELESSVVLVDSAQDSGPRGIQVKITLPEQLSPGFHGITVGGKETVPSSATISAVAAVQSSITVLSLYDGKYPVVQSISAQDINSNESTNITINLVNYGKEPITLTQAVLRIYDEDNSTITTIRSDVQEITSNGLATLTAVFDSKSFALKPNTYHIDANIFYDGQQLPETYQTTFRIGQLSIDPFDITKIIYVNTTNKITVYVRSDWAGTIENVYAKIYTPDGKTLKTPQLDVRKFDNAYLETYWEVKDLPLGKSTLRMELFYAGQTLNKEFAIELKNAPVIEKVVEEPKQTSGLSTMTIIMIGLGIIILLNVVYMVFIRRERRNNTIQPPNTPPKL